MNNFDIGKNSTKIAMQYRNFPPTIEEFNKLIDNITKECRKYLIGKISEREKNNRAPDEQVYDVYSRIGKEFSYTGASIKNLISYTRAIDCLYRITPDAASDILAGKIRIAYKNVTVLAKMESADIYTIIERHICEKTPSKLIFKEQKECSKIKKRGRPKRNFLDLPRISVKDTPPYDPDSQIMALVYTIPSWISSVDKTFMNTDLYKISQTARDKLVKELLNLKNTTDAMLSLLTEKKSEKE